MSKARFNCFLCGQKAKKSDFCFGCRVFICAECEHPVVEILNAGHKPSDHSKCPSCSHGEKAANAPKWANAGLSVVTDAVPDIIIPISGWEIDDEEYGNHLHLATDDAELGVIYSAIFVVKGKDNNLGAPVGSCSLVLTKVDYE